MGEPKTVPVGLYTHQALNTLGMWQELSKKTLVYGQSATLVLSWVSRGEVDAAITYASEISRSDNVKVAAWIPEGSHETIEYQMARLHASEGKEVDRVLSLFRSEHAKMILRQKGFLVR